MPAEITGLVTTIIPVYNRPLMVRKAVESVLAQTYRPIEIILVNDGSTDNTHVVLNTLAEDNPETIRVIHKENGGPGLAREAGRIVAQGEFIQYLDSDDWLLPDKFTVQVKSLRDRPDCGIAYGISRLVDEGGNVLREPSKRTGERHEYLFPALLVDRWWHTHTPLFRRSVSDAAGPWPKQRPEDWDLEARMGALRTRLVFCDRVLSCQLDHASENRVTRGAREAYLRDESWFLPRLYECALKAGVAKEALEMQYFSRWAFMRARHLGAMGESRIAWDLYRLAERSSASFRLPLFLVGSAARLLGWTLVGKASLLREHIPGRERCLTP